MGGVIVPEATSEKWFSKFIDYSDFYGSNQDGKLLYHDREVIKINSRSNY